LLYIVSHLLATDGPGYFFNGEEKYDVIVQRVLNETIRSKKREGETILKGSLADSRMELSRCAV
jgi:hypothetical protein